MKKKKIGIFSVIFLFASFFSTTNADAIVIPYEKQLLSHALNKKKSTQVILVKADKANSFKATLAAYEYTDGEWKRVYTFPAVIGKNGISAQKKEGDGKSPAGMYLMGQGFGQVNKPADVKIPYKKTTNSDYWIDDVNSQDYNRWKVYTGDPVKKWKSFERLNQPLYKYAAVIRYNEKPIKGRGSAIFLHIWRNSASPTAGCTALAEGNVLKLMKWMDLSKRTLIIEGTDADLKRMSQL